MEANTLSLFEVSAKLGVSPSAIKKRVANLNLPVLRGARSKLIFDERAFGLLLQADELLKAGHGFEECRRRLGLDQEAAEAVEATLVAPEPEAIAPEPEAEPEVLEIVVPAVEVEPVEEVEDEEVAPEPVADSVVEPESESDDDGPLRPLPPPVFIQLGRRKAEAAAASAATSPTAAPVAESPELISRLDRTLKLIEEKEKQNQQLQAKLLVAYDEMTKLSATAAAFQERSLNLQHEVTKLQSELRLLTAPAGSKPWWKFWA